MASCITSFETHCLKGSNNHFLSDHSWKKSAFKEARRRTTVDVKLIVEMAGGWEHPKGHIKRVSNVERVHRGTAGAWTWKWRRGRRRRGEDSSPSHSHTCSPSPHIHKLQVLQVLQNHTCWRIFPKVCAFCCQFIRLKQNLPFLLCRIYVSLSCFWVDSKKLLFC